MIRYIVFGSLERVQCGACGAGCKLSNMQPNFDSSEVV